MDVLWPPELVGSYDFQATYAFASQSGYVGVFNLSRLNCEEFLAGIIHHDALVVPDSSDCPVYASHIQHASERGLRLLVRAGLPGQNVGLDAFDHDFLWVVGNTFIIGGSESVSRHQCFYPTWFSLCDHPH